jgi:hypothetical protein
MELSHLFSSASKYRILRTLSIRNTPIHLRGLVELADVQLRSAQIAVEKLIRDAIVTKTKQKNRSMLSLNPHSQYATQLRAHFKAEEERRNAARALQYKNVSELLERIHELRMLSWRE